jgi:hypothetical protein
MNKKKIFRVGLLAMTVGAAFASKPSKVSGSCDPRPFVGSYCEDWNVVEGCVSWCNYQCDGCGNNCQTVCGI